MVVTSPNAGLQTAMPSTFKTFRAHCKEASNPGTTYKNLTNYLTTVRYLWSVYSLPADNWWTWWICLFYPSLLLRRRKLFHGCYAQKTHTHTHTIRYVNNCNVTVPAERHYFGLNILGISSVPPPDQGILSYQYTVIVLVILVPDFRHSETF